MQIFDSLDICPSLWPHIQDIVRFLETTRT